MYASEISFIKLSLLLKYHSSTAASKAPETNKSTQEVAIPWKTCKKIAW